MNRRFILFVCLFVMTMGMVSVVSANPSVNFDYVKNGETHVYTTDAFISEIEAGTVAPDGSVTSYHTSFEVAEGYEIGTCAGQMGWQMLSASHLQGHVTAVHPSEGEKHAKFALDVSAPKGDFVGCFSPHSEPASDAPSSMQMDISISATGGADYNLIGQSLSDGCITSWVKMSFLGDILVLDDTGGGLMFVDTGTDWTVNGFGTVKAAIDPVNETLVYSYNGTQIYSGVGGIICGSAIEQVVYLSDNCQVSDNADIDNIFFDNGSKVTAITLSSAETSATSQVATSYLFAALILSGATALSLRKRK